MSLVFAFLAVHNFLTLSLTHKLVCKLRAHHIILGPVIG
jgi:hypothetical protein